ncbi:MAG TPA: hypothetical protein EYQ23_12870 [Verrucomicrobiales bacterium]|nr:hypothetical protein [Verrucomicrobiales bacterium]
MLLEGLLELLPDPPLELLLGMLLEKFLELLLGVSLELDPEWILFIGAELLLELSELTILLAGGRFDFLGPDFECLSS